MGNQVRWRQRFQHFDRAVRLLREPIDRGVDSLSALEKEGTAQRFEMTVELGWKTSHTYDQKVLDEAVAEIESTYMKAINNLHAWFHRQTT